MTLVVAVLAQTKVWQGWDMRAFDAWTVITAPGESRLPIVIVGIDDLSIQQIGQRWPWSRRLHGELVTKLADAGAMVVAFDVIFDHPTDASSDRAFADAIARAGNVVLAATRFRQETPQGTLWSRYDPETGLTDAGARVGMVNIEFEGDQVVRRFPEAGDSFWKAVLSLVRARNDTIGFEANLDRRHWIRFLGPDHSFPFVSFSTVLAMDAKQAHDAFEGALVLVGRETTAASDIGSAQIDTFATPFTFVTGRLSPGVELWATMLDNSVNRSALVQMAGWGQMLLNGVLALWCALFPWRYTPTRCVAVSISATALVIAVSYALFAGLNLWLPVLGPVAACTLMLLARSAHAYVHGIRERARIRAAFSLFVPSSVAESLVEQSGAMEPGGVEKHITVLFTDLAGFTTTSEGLQPSQVARLLNIYFDRMTEVVFQHGGTVQGFSGDALMAFWGAPLDDEHHARKAVMAAREMMLCEEGINRRLVAEGLPAVFTRIGIHTGLAIVGNIGSRVRFNYTALGDTPNLASRLEGLNKRYGTQVLLSGETVKAADPAGPYRPVERVRVKGRKAPVDVFTLADTAENVAASEMALRHFRNREWSQARSIWIAQLEKTPGDPIARFYLDRLGSAADAVDSKWDAVAIIEEK